MKTSWRWTAAAAIHFFKPDWSPDLLRSYAYTNHFAVYRKSIMEKAGIFREKFHGAQDYDLTLRVVDITQNIYHIPKVLYHWRKIEGSAAEVVDAKGYALVRAKQALEDHIKRNGWKASVSTARNAPGCFRVRYEITGEPKVSVLLPTRGQVNREDPRAARLLMRCIRSIVQKTDYPNYELVVTYNNTIDPEIEEFFQYRPHKLVKFPLEGHFNFAAKANHMAEHATGEHFVIFNDDLEIIAPDWLSALLEFSQQKDVGTVGSKLLYPDNRLQHIGMVLGINGYPAHIFHQAPPGYPGYMAHANLIRNYSATTGAAMMVKRSIWEELGGLDEKFAIDYNDVDFCLRALEAGFRNVFTPYSLMYHHESAELSGNRLAEQETSRFRERWAKYLENDPYYKPQPDAQRGGLQFRGIRGAIDESCTAGRRIWNPAFRENRPDPQADGGDRRLPDPVAHYEYLRRS